MPKSLETRLESLEQRTLDFDPKPLAALVRAYVLPDDGPDLGPRPPLPPATARAFWGVGDPLGDLLRDMLRTAVEGVP